MIPEANHFFEDCIDDLQATVGAYLDKRLGMPRHAPPPLRKERAKPAAAARRRSGIGDAAVSLITTTEELDAACLRMARHPFVTVDTEFLRETTFWPILCVVQLASDDEALAIDALAEGLDLQPLLALMADEDVVKVFHAARQDLEIFWKLAGRRCRRRCSTPRSRRWSAATATRSPTASWCIRSAMSRSTSRRASPTGRAGRWREAQIDYAIGDVTHLRDIYKALAEAARRRPAGSPGSRTR